MQDDRCVKVHRRDEQGTGRADPEVYRDGKRFELLTLSSAIAVAEPYEGVLDGSGRSLLR